MDTNNPADDFYDEHEYEEAAELLRGGNFHITDQELALRKYNIERVLQNYMEVLDFCIKYVRDPVGLVVIAKVNHSMRGTIVGTKSIRNDIASFNTPIGKKYLSGVPECQVEVNVNGRIYRTLLTDWLIELPNICPSSPQLTTQECKQLIGKRCKRAHFGILSIKEIEKELGFEGTITCANKTGEIAISFDFPGGKKIIDHVSNWVVLWTGLEDEA